MCIFFMPRYTVQNNKLNRRKKVRVFLCGDYEFLCRLYGLSGASGLIHTLCHYCDYITFINVGRHCCLWCLITSSQLKLPPSSRGPVSLWTTESICTDYEGFEKSGKKIKEAKNHNNVIEKPFFISIPLSQVNTLSN